MVTDMQYTDMRYNVLHVLTLLMLTVGLAVAPAQAQSNDEKVTAAKEAAAEWIELLDANDYQATWEQAASLLKSQVTADQWANQIQQVHSQFGELQERSLIAARYTTSLPNVPEGEYVIAQYRAQYGNQTLIETATLTKDGDAWRVAGYVVRPENQG